MKTKKTKRKTKKPEISYNRETDTFLRDNKPIKLWDAKRHWYNVDADWTVGAYEAMRVKA